MYEFYAIIGRVTVKEDRKRRGLELVGAITTSVACLTFL